jgi:hypothetical protein
MSVRNGLSALIEALPHRLRADYTKNKTGFGGDTLEMDEAGGNMLVNLQRMWSELATSGFPSQAFGSPAAQWIERYAEGQAQLFRVLNEPQGPGTGGTIVPLLVEGDVMDALQALIARTVKALISTEESTAGYDLWERRWKAAVAG